MTSYRRQSRRSVWARHPRKMCRVQRLQTKKKAARQAPVQTPPPIEQKAHVADRKQDSGGVDAVKGYAKDVGDNKVGCFCNWRKVFRPSQWDGKHAEAAAQWLQFMGDGKTQKEATAETRRLIMPSSKGTRARKTLSPADENSAAGSPTAKKQRQKLTVDELDHARTRAADYASRTTCGPKVDDTWQSFVGRRLKMLAAE